MSLWAWLTYSSAYTWVVVKAPLSLTLWQHLYSLNVLLIVQETADTFGLVCLGVLFLSAQIFSRNYLLSTFLLAPSQSNLNPDKGSFSRSANNVKALSNTTVTLSHFKTLLSSTLTQLSQKLRR